METKLVGDFSRIHGIGEILLVGKHQQERVAKLVLIQHALELITGF